MLKKERRSDQHLLKKGEEMKNLETFDQWNVANELFQSQTIKVRNCFGAVKYLIAI